MKTLTSFVFTTLWTAIALAGNPKPPIPTPPAEVAVRAVKYDAQLGDVDAKFAVELDLDVRGKGGVTLPLFDGELAVLTTKLPDGMQLSRAGNVYSVTLTKEGRQTLKLDLLAKITRAEPWNSVTFTGPTAVIGSVNAQATGTGVELQLLKGTLLEAGLTGGVTRVRGFLGAERTVALRWQSKAEEIKRKALLTCDTRTTVQVTPTVLKYVTTLNYEIVQGSVTRLTATLPATQALTKLQGAGIRDWAVKTEEKRQTLTVEFIKPVEKSYTLTVFSEQTVDRAVATLPVDPLAPQEVEREAGTLTVSAEDVLVEMDAVTGLRQVNAPAGALAGYQFHARPFSLSLKLRRIEPVLTAADRVTVRVEETRLLVTHALTLHVEKAGIYTLELVPPAGLTVADVRGEGVADWKMVTGKLQVTFANRVLGGRKLEVQLERAESRLETAPTRTVAIEPLRVTGAVKETAQIGAGAVAGVQLKTVAEGLAGLREMPINALPQRTDEVLAYQAEQAAWKLTLTAERLTVRLIADVFNLITVGDGLVGGSATLRYAILNQGVQEFQVKLPAHWKNIEFTGPNIRRKEQHGDTWTITLQEKAWGAYTLVLTYDFQFDPQRASLPIGSAHAVGVERETGSVAITSAANLQIAEGKKDVGRVEPTARPQAEDGRAGGSSLPTATTTFRRIDEGELTEADRALITRPVLLAYRYTGDDYELTVEVTRFKELPILEAVADRTQLTTVLTEHGQLLTQASFMVKNNDKQFQTFTLPAGADFWSCFVRGEPAKPERSGNQLLVPLPRGANRDEAFAVDIVYAQKIGDLKSWTPRSIALAAPVTDVQTTYAEWELYVPRTHRLANFAGNMIIARGTTQSVTDVLLEVLRTYSRWLRHDGEVLVLVAILFAFCVLILAGIRRGWRGALAVAAGLVVFGLLLAMLLPSLSKARERARYASSISAIEIQAEAPPPPAAGWEAGDRGVAPSPEPSPVIINGSGFGTTAGAAVIVPGAGVAMPVVAGIRPIRIEIPKTGNRFAFTKVLNIRSEALTLGAVAVDDMLFKSVRGLAQALVFVVGLVLVWWQWRRSSFLVALGLTLALGGVGSLLHSARALDAALILCGPVLGAVLFVWLLMVIWKRIPKKQPPPLPPVMVVLALMLAAGAGHAEESNPPVTGVSATYTGSVREPTGTDRRQVAEFEGVFELRAAEANQTVRLFGSDVAVQEFSGPKGTTKSWWGAKRETEARLVRTDGNVSVQLPAKGNATVRVKFLVKLTGDIARRQIAFGIPPALATRLALTLDETDAMVEAPTAVSLKTSAAAPGKTRVDVVLAAASQVELSWTPRTKRAADIAATVFCQNLSLAMLGGGILNVRSTLDFTVTQGELRQMQVGLPAGQRLMRVEGDSIRTWKLDGQTLTVELVKGMSPNYRLTVETEKPLDGDKPSVKIETPHALQVKRETGLLALKSAEELNVSVESTEDLQKVDVEEYSRATGNAKPAPAEIAGSAYRFLKPEFGLTVRVEPVRPQIEAVVNHTLQLSAEQIGLTATVNYTIKRAGVFALRLAIPTGYRVEKVTGNGISQWTEDKAAALLNVVLKERTLGGYTLTVQLARTLREVPPQIELTGVQPLDTQKLTGFVSVISEEGLQVKTDTFGGMTEVPAAMVGLTGSALAYKLIPADVPATTADWKLAVNTEKIESWIRAEVVNWVTLTETLVSGRTLIRYEIQNAPAKEFRVLAPAGLKNVEVSGANIRRKDYDATTGAWRIELQSKVRGTYLLTVTWDRPWNVKEGRLDLTGMQVPGVERETGWLAVTAPAQFRVDAPATTTDLSKIEPRDLPEWAGRPAAPPTLAYRYLRPAYKLTLATQRFDEAEVLQALVDNVTFTTVVSEDGQMMTEMKLAIRNNARQYLEILLPAGTSNVWSAFVAGQPVRPTVRDGKLLLPLERSGADGAPVSVELTYVSTGRFPQRRGSITLDTPAVDVPLKNARWDLYLPPDYAYGSFEGSMRHEKLAAAVETAQLAATSYDWASYAKIEGANKSYRDLDQKRSLSSARSNIVGGKINDAYQYYNRAKGNMNVDDAVANEELKKLEKDIRKEQGKQLIQAQRQYRADNSGQQSAQPNAPVDVQQILMVQEDETAAAQQAEKVSKAQEIVVTKALPLRVNLPQRGQRLTFTQTLQTEVRKPMSVQFTATATKTLEWPATIGLAVTGLAGLWLLVGFVLRRK
jgi:hypothetical protein